jgi:hypothetical protein
MVRRRGDERSFQDHVTGKGVMKSFSDHMVSRRGDERSFQDHVIGKGVMKSFSNHMVRRREWILGEGGVMW